MTADELLDRLRAMGSEADAAGSAAYHKVDRPYLGVRNPVLSDLARDLRRSLPLDERLALASGLWDSNVHEGRILAAKLLEQARIRPDDRAAWDLIVSWVPQFDGWAIADHASISGAKRLIADPSRLEIVEGWITADHMWSRRAALVMTLPWTRMNTPKPAEIAARERILGWAESLVPDRDWFIQKAIAWWLRDLSKHDPDRVRSFLEVHGPAMKPFAVKEAQRHMGTPDQAAAPE
ncbi:DNA alkylation repair protein [Ponticoccus sp. SC2-23]|uniref:DNA alkylation repair protein n=1 Tax=Alexandriicola marinus TaxID=2081710 RepID=UPI000FDCC012|nr:DNA alkylation repair protein [Alexandriicola marinus]MBM1219431.1 DNA alkylation repair protein [Ponticoccus sp. SC6-9]MBM1223497.1 DNA alkylation repair protein [Ponticoccus sp. SC6-15]MBM1229244.1 DNA alkylation repair protein [Ponticoccus sp. SC6-38]MBM1232463.1 DNA alkylation repair protein [Ponticoccus sp. SC6-45]MBM1237587.1 DNA alkylation repair protein [Ponticoccus sp. SC6-49]MBM1241474.1 DNA alkylation repair protein [Ponticoccus sp. SC2-64]MBM1245987.1 DNA alkylation repair pro